MSSDYDPLELQLRINKLVSELRGSPKAIAEIAVKTQWALEQDSADHKKEKLILLKRAEAAEARAERLQAVIIGMFPMWINAMSYCEHGRQSELLAMRNYYNGRANPMTNDDISLMFSVIPEKNEGGGE